MKKLFVIIAILFVLGVTLVSCNKNNAGDNTNETSDETGDTPNINEGDSEEGNKGDGEDEHVHSFGEWKVIVESTCIQTGKMERTCSCGKMESMEVAISENHKEEVILGINPTCTDDGLTEGKKCSDCGEILKKQTVIEKTGHSTSEWIVDKHPTCNEDGSKYRICVSCGVILNTEIIDALGYSAGLVFSLNDDNESYTVLASDACTDECVIIPSTYNGKPVTNIGDYAFYDNDSMISITIPSSVKSVGYEAFKECYSLKSVYISDIVAWCDIYFTCLDTDSYCFSNPLGQALYLYLNGEIVTNLVIPEEVSQVRDYAFFGCNSLESIVIPDTVTYIGEFAFSWCTSLVSVTIPNSVTSINRGTFEECNTLVSITIPESVTKIDDSAFSSCDLLANVNIPKFVTSVGAYSFFDCESLTSVIIPDSVKSIGRYAFSDCILLTDVSIGDSVSTVGDNAFRNCALLKNVTFGDSLIGIADSMFWECSSLTSITLPSSVTSIGSSAFYNCTSLRSITIPDSVTSIGEYAFQGCLIEDVRMPAMALDAMSKDSLKFVVITSGVIPVVAFYDSTSLISVTIGDSVTKMGSYAFNGCTSLESVTIGNSITRIPTYAFNGCTSLRSIIIPDSVTSIGEYAFQGCRLLISATIGKSVTSIEYGAFWNCISLIEVCNKSALNITAGSYDNGYVGTDAKHIIADESESYLKYVGDYIFYDDGSYVYLIKYFGNQSEIILPKYNNGKEYVIWHNAFGSCTTLTSVTIPDYVTSIDRSAFAGCTSLTSITIPNSVTSIGNSAFASCTSLTSITIPNSVTAISENLFYNCKKLKTIIIPDSVISIGGAAFDKCTSLKGITLPDSVTTISYSAFADCTSLTSITIPNSVISIGERVFENCTALKSVTIGNSVTSIGNYAFSYCYGLENVIIPNSVTKIGKWAFNQCTSLESIVIPSSVTDIDEHAFWKCHALKNVNYIGDIEEWVSIVFFDYISNPMVNGSNFYINGELVTSLVIPASVTNINRYAFVGCISLTSVIFENSEGWWCATSDDATSGISITSTDLENSATAIEYLRYTYRSYYWKRS